MTIHDLKTWPEYYQAVKSGKKKFEYRKADRPYAIGDLLHLMEYDPEKQEFTGDEILMGVGYILHGGSMGIPDGYCIMSIFG